jgi:hypothetical protein
LLYIQAAGQDAEQKADSVVIPLRISAGLEISGPVIYFTDKSTLNLEGFVSGDINEKMSVFLGTGYSDFSYSQYNYNFTAKGIYFRVGPDFNLLRPEMAVGKYWAGLGIHYGLSNFSYETSSYRHDNYWGSVTSSLPGQSGWAHYLEVSGGFKAELFRNFNIGWLINVRKMVYSGADKNLPPIYYPGYGNGGKTISFGLNYYISWSIPYKKIKVKIKPEPVEEPEEDEETQNQDETQSVGRQGIGR